MADLHAASFIHSQTVAAAAVSHASQLHHCLMKLRITVLQTDKTQPAHKLRLRPSAIHHLPCLYSLFVADALIFQSLVDILEHPLKILLHIGAASSNMLFFLLPEMLCDTLAPIVKQLVFFLLSYLITEHTPVELTVEAIVFMFLTDGRNPFLPMTLISLAKILHLPHLICLDTHCL